MSLHVADYHAAERTFQLLTQAVGRAGRGQLPGQAVIQTYDPEHFAIQTAKAQDYESFYQHEIVYRKMMHYPPIWNMLLVHCMGKNEQITQQTAQLMADKLQSAIKRSNRPVILVGPADATIAKSK